MQTWRGQPQARGADIYSRRFLEFRDLNGLELHGARTWADRIHFKNSGEINEKNIVGLSACRHAVAVGTLYPNFAAIDQIDAKAATITTKHYGSREAMLEAAKKRSEIRDVVASKLAREVIPK
jgi:hypothetical protein